MVRICAALSFYDEPPAFLSRCVRSLAGVVDELVAVDGAWRYQPLVDGRHVSSPDQVEPIWEAQQVGIRTRLVIPEGLYESQVVKRQQLMALAAEDADWVLVIDGDEYVSEKDPDTLRRELAETDLLCGYVGFKNLNRGETMPGTTPHSGLNRRLYKAGTTVTTVHSGYMYEGRNLLVSESALDLRHCLALEHDNVNRGHERNQRARAYRLARSQYRVEMWMPLGA